MLHIDDIKQRLLEHPEPKEVTEIREHILKAFNKLEFIEEGHKYFLHNDDGTVDEMTSVSHICHLFEPEVDWEEKAMHVALKEGVDVSVIKRRWEENNLLATSNGTKTHSFAEAYMWFFMGKPENMPQEIYKTQYENGYLIPYGENEKAIVKFYEDLSKVDNFYCVLPETKIYISSKNNPYNIKYDISGTFDALFAFKNKDGEFVLSVFDWKTNRSLEKEYARNNLVTLLEPFNDISFINEPKSFYTIQLSLYQLGLEQIGYKVADRKLLWLSADSEYHKIQVPDVRIKLIDFLSKENV